MKYFNLLTIMLLCTVVTFYACDDAADARKQEAKDALVVPDNSATPMINSQTTPPPANTPEPAQNAAGVWHYTCSAGCAGGAGAAGTCATCGGALAHNQAYHTPTPGSTPSATPPIPGATNTLTPPSPPTPEPAQNAAGVWHYTCGAGCAGGAGAAGTCGKCGGALAHNAAYHN